MPVSATGKHDRRNSLNTLPGKENAIQGNLEAQKNRFAFESAPQSKIQSRPRHRIVRTAKLRFGFVFYLCFTS
jgi:hypothetical protein